MAKSGYKAPPVLTLDEAYTIFRLDRQSLRDRPSSLRSYHDFLHPFCMAADAGRLPYWRND